MNYSYIFFLQIYNLCLIQVCQVNLRGSISNGESSCHGNVLLAFWFKLILFSFQVTVKNNIQYAKMVIW